MKTDLLTSALRDALMLHRWLGPELGCTCRGFVTGYDGYIENHVAPALEARLYMLRHGERGEV